MGITKTEEFSEVQNKIARIAKVLAHPARVAILQYLIEKKSCYCGGLVEEMPLSQATISQHLKELKNIGLIKGEIEGPRMCYCINEEVWKDCRLTMETLFNLSLGSANCC